MPAEDFSACLSWETCFSAASMELVRSAYSKRRMALGQAPAIWDNATHAWDYTQAADAPASGFHFQSAAFWGGIQAWLLNNAGHFVDPSMDWNNRDMTGAAPDHWRPWTMNEMAIFDDDTSYPKFYSGTYATGMDRAGVLARALPDYASALKGSSGGRLGFRVSTDYRRVSMGSDPAKGGEYLYDYTVGAESYFGLCLSGDYVAGNPATLDPWLFVDVCALFSVCHKILVPFRWKQRPGEYNVRYGYHTNALTRAYAASRAAANFEKSRFKASGFLTSPHHYSATYAADPEGGTPWGELMNVEGWGHYPNLAGWMVVDLDMANDFEGVF